MDVPSAQPVPVTLPPVVPVDLLWVARHVADHSFWLFSSRERACSSAFLNGKNCWSPLLVVPLLSQCPYPCHSSCV